MLEIEEVNQLSEKRKLHSIGVMKMCEKLAERYGENPKRAMAVGLAHDMAKEMPEEEKMKYVKENKIQASELEYNNVDILHGEIAADICKKKYGFDEEMCSAIANHTMGKTEMTMLEKILFIADKIDETREYEGVEELRKLAFEDIDLAILQNLDNTIKINLDKKRVIFEQSIKTRNFILINNKK